MISKEVIQGDLCAWFKSITDITFIQANPQPPTPSITGEVTGTPRPQGLYGTVNILTLNSVGAADRFEYENEAAGPDVVSKISGHRVIQVSINVFRQGAFDVINTLYTALQRNSSIEYFKARCLGYRSRSEIRDVTLASAGSLEERHQFDLFLHTVATDEEIVLAIESITIFGTIDNGATIVKQVEIEVDNT